MSSSGRVESLRKRSAGELRELREAICSETGFRLGATAWPLLIVGLAIGVEAARRLFGASGGRSTSPTG